MEGACSHPLRHSSKTTLQETPSTEKLPTRADLAPVPAITCWAVYQSSQKRLSAPLFLPLSSLKREQRDKAATGEQRISRAAQKKLNRGKG